MSQRCLSGPTAASRLVRALSWSPLLLLLALAACSPGRGSGKQATPRVTPPWRLTAQAIAEATPTPPPIDLTLSLNDVSIEPLPLRAGFPFTITAEIHNKSGRPAVGVPVMVYLSSLREEFGYQPFLEVLTVTVPATQPLSLQVPVRWNLPGGEHRLWIGVNRTPGSWQSRAPNLPEERWGDNAVGIDLMVQPFDAYETDLCPGRVDVEIGPDDVSSQAGDQRLRVRVHNVGNRAVYNLPVVVSGDRVSGLGYTPAIAPCGGAAEVVVETDRPLSAGEVLSVEVNPEAWTGRLREDDSSNNRVTARVPALAEVAATAGPELVDYDFSISGDEIETPQPWIVLVTVHNLGTRDAAEVPIRVENPAGRKITDVIPLVQGSGRGVAAIRVGYLWTKGATLTFTVNPPGVKGSYPESNRANNVATFTLP